VIGDKSGDGATITAQKVYSGAFRTISGTVLSVTADGKSVTVKDLATKKPIEIALGEDAAVHRLPLGMATMLARRFNPSYKTGGWSGAQRRPRLQPACNGQTAPPTVDKRADGRRNGTRGGNGDISQMLERAPKIALSDLKQGDAVVISGAATGADNTRCSRRT